jgi:hypothetical protein
MGTITNERSNQYRSGFINYIINNAEVNESDISDIITQREEIIHNNNIIIGLLDEIIALQSVTSNVNNLLGRIKLDIIINNDKFIIPPPPEKFKIHKDYNDIVDLIIILKAQTIGINDTISNNINRIALCTILNTDCIYKLRKYYKKYHDTGFQKLSRKISKISKKILDIPTNIKDKLKILISSSPILANDIEILRHTQTLMPRSGGKNKSEKIYFRYNNIKYIRKIYYEGTIKYILFKKTKKYINKTKVNKYFIILNGINTMIDFL